MLSIVGETAQEKRNLKCHHSIVYKNLNKSGPWIYQNSFIWLFPIEKCSICPKVPEKSFLGGKAAGDRENFKDVEQLEEIVETEVCPDHVHMLVENPLKSGIKFHGRTEGQEQSGGLGKVAGTEL